MDQIWTTEVTVLAGNAGTAVAAGTAGLLTRSGITSFDAHALAALSITATLSDPAPQHGEAVRWLRRCAARRQPDLIAGEGAAAVATASMSGPASAVGATTSKPSTTRTVSAAELVLPEASDQEPSLPIAAAPRVT